MNREEKMEAHERELFHKVRKAIYANPFDQKRLAIDLDITGLSKREPTDRILRHLLAKISDTIEDITSRGETISSQRNKNDEELLKFGILFHIYHRFSDQYDDHIRKQATTSDQNLVVEFGPQVLSLLLENGLTEKESLRFFSLFFQMRRAFYFIGAIAGRSTCVMDLRKSLWNNIFTGDIRIYDEFLWNRMEDFSTMILGETGTGKGMAAAAIGRSGYIPYDPKKNIFSESFSRAFIPVNLSQFPEQLIESELFGHKKGAFTGAIETHNGLLSHCSPCGAIFLDEIGDVSIPVQIKLLQVLQDRTFTPVGSHKMAKFQGRVIAATNKSLESARRKGIFRDDFYYRLCSDVIHVPPLGQRIAEHPGEMQILVGITLQRILGIHSDSLLEQISSFIHDNQPRNYPWPGNIRELEQCVRSILLNNHYIWQTVDRGSHDDPLVAAMDIGNLTAHELLAHYCFRLYKKLGTYEAVSQQTRLDRRTVKKYITMVSN